MDLSATRLLTLCAAIVLTVASWSATDPFDPMASAYERPTRLGVPVAETAPMADGALGAGEWDCAAAVTGLSSHKSGLLIAPGPVLFVAYDAEALHMLMLVPGEEGRKPRSAARQRDGAVHRDDSIEVFLKPPDGPVYQIVINAAGTVADYRERDLLWNGSAQVAAGLVGPGSLPDEWGVPFVEGWLVEASFPWTDFGSGAPEPGQEWPANFAVNRSGPWAVLGSIIGGPFDQADKFVKLRFLPPGAPYAQITEMGQACWGDIQLQGAIVNPGPSSIEVIVRLDARKAGSHLTQDAYHNVVGFIKGADATLEVPAGQRRGFRVPLQVQDPRADRLAFRAEIKSRAAEGPGLLARPVNARIRPPLSVTASNVPSGKYVVLDVDASGIWPSLAAKQAELAISVTDAEGTTVLREQASLTDSAAELRLSYAGLPIGAYGCHVAAVADGAQVATARAQFRHVAAPSWLTSTVYDDYGKADRVPLPWTPVKASKASITVWGRVITWTEQSLLPTSITTGGTELLTTPMRLTVTVDGAERVFALDTFRITDRRDSRVSMSASGRVGSIRAHADMWVEYDGFLWVDLLFDDDLDGQTVECLRVEAPLAGERMTLYQTFSRQLTGAIGREPIRIPWLDRPDEHIANFYHWFGNEDGGLGFTYSTLEHWRPASEDEFATYTPGKPAALYTMNLLQRPASVRGRRYRFGIQATPIKPLPPDYHSMVGCKLNYNPWVACTTMPENVDITSIWPPGNFKGLNDPYHTRRENVLKNLKWAHDRGLALVPVGCPQKISPQSDEFEDWRLEMQCMPDSILNWKQVPHYQNCGRSYALRKWLFYGWAIENVQKLGLDGIYYDGWQTGQIACSNPHHGCGWVDETGKRHVTVPVLEGREFNQRMLLFLQDNVKGVQAKQAPPREGFPSYHYWIHSWNFVPPVMGFATEWLTGEFTAYPLKGTGMLKPEGTYGKCLGLDRFRALCLSTNWGVPNMFDALMWEHTRDHPTDKQTLMAYAWFLPHGVPIGLVELMNQKTVLEISRLLMQFDTRRSRFTPGWRDNPYVEVASPDLREVMAATWDHDPERDVLIVVSNLHSEQPQDIRLRWKADWKPALVNARTQAGVPVEDGQVDLRLEPESFVLIRALARAL